MRRFDQDGKFLQALKDDPKQLKSAAHPPGLGRFKSDPYFLSMYSIWYHAKCVRAFTGDKQDQVHPQGLRTIPKAAVRHSNKCGQLHQPLQPRCAMCTAHTGSSVPGLRVTISTRDSTRTHRENSTMTGMNSHFDVTTKTAARVPSLALPLERSWTSTTRSHIPISTGFPRHLPD